MRILFVTYLGIQGLEANVERNNGNNTAIIAMGDPFRSMFISSEDPTDELASLLYCREVVKGHLPDLGGIVIAVEDDGWKQAGSMAEYYRSQKPDGEVHFVIKEDRQPPDSFDMIDLNPIVHHHSGNGDSRRVMQLLLQRYLALGSLNGRF